LQQAGLCKWVLVKRPVARIGGEKLVDELSGKMAQVAARFNASGLKVGILRATC
jgi:hypothetical protein